MKYAERYCIQTLTLKKLLGEVLPQHLSLNKELLYISHFVGVDKYKGKPKYITRLQHFILEEDMRSTQLDLALQLISVKTALKDFLAFK